MGRNSVLAYISPVYVQRVGLLTIYARQYHRWVDPHTDTRSGESTIERHDCQLEYYIEKNGKMHRRIHSDIGVASCAR